VRLLPVRLLGEVEALEELPRFLIRLLDRVVEAAAGRLVEPVLRAVHGVERRVVGLVHRILGATEETADGVEQPHSSNVDDAMPGHQRDPVTRPGGGT
jgi:hypothetical protein